MDRSGTNSTLSLKGQLLRAIRAGEVDAVDRLLDEGVGLEERLFVSGSVHSPLETAVLTRHAAVVRLLVGRGAAIDASGGDGWTPLTYADANDFENIVDLLLSLGASPSTRGAHGYTAAHRAAGRGAVGSTLENAVRDSGVDPLDASDETPLILAVRHRHEPTARELIGLEADVDHVATDPVTGNQWSVLTEAAYQSSVDKNTTMVEMLLDAGADPNPPGRPPLSACVTQLVHTNLATLHRLITAGADPTAVNPVHGDTLLHRATQVGSQDAIEAVLALDVNLEAVDRDGRTPLLAAVHQENTDSVRLLVAHGANVAAVDPEGNSAQELALIARDPGPLLEALARRH
ncbi:MAG: ankyrin repeat domain-containing protein [Microthrixaceae bacterium]